MAKIMQFVISSGSMPVQSAEEKRATRSTTMTLKSICLRCNTALKFFLDQSINFLNALISAVNWLSSVTEESLKALVHTVEVQTSDTSRFEKIPNECR